MKGKYIQLAKLRPGDVFHLGQSDDDAAQSWEVLRHFEVLIRDSESATRREARTRVRRLFEARTMPVQEPLSSIMVFVREPDPADEDLQYEIQREEQAEREYDEYYDLNIYED